MSTARKILSNTIIQIVGKVLLALFSIIAVKILTTYLGKDLYGQYNTIYIYLSFFSIIADLGIYTIAVREMSRKEEQMSLIIGNILSIRTILATLSVGVAVILSFFIPQYAGTFVPMGILISGIGTIIALINGVLVSVFQTSLKMQYATLSLITGKIVSVAILAIVAFFLFPKSILISNPENIPIAFYLTIVAGIVSSISMVIVTLFYSKKIVNIAYKFDIDVWKKLIKESLPYGIALILGTVYLRVDGLLLSLMKGTEEVGIYSVATKIIEVTNVLPVLFMSTVLPVMTRYIEQKSDKIKVLLRYSFSFLFALAFPILVGLFILSYQVVYLIATPEFLSRIPEGFYGSDMALKILSFALFFSFINNLFIYVLVSINHQIKLLLINGGAVLFNILTNLIAIPLWGFRGASVTTVLSELLVLFFTFYFSRKSIRFKVDVPAIFKIMFSGLLMGISIYFLREFIISRFQNKGVFILIAIGGIIYVLSLILTKAVTKEQMKLVMKK